MQTGIDGSVAYIHTHTLPGLLSLIKFIVMSNPLNEERMGINEEVTFLLTPM